MGYGPECRSVGRENRQVDFDLMLHLVDTDKRHFELKLACIFVQPVEDGDCAASRRARELISRARPYALRV